MIYRISNLITNKICKYKLYSKDEIEKIDYALKALLGEGFKLVILFIIFFYLGKLHFFFFSLLLLMTIRSFAGGMHFDTTFKCLVFTTLFFIVTSFIAPNILIKNFNTYYILGSISFIIICIKSPCPSHKRPISNKKRRRILKNLSIISTAVWLFILLIYVDDVELINCGISTLFLLSIQLINIKESVFNENFFFQTKT
jgi:accessory gene regulator B